MQWRNCEFKFSVIIDIGKETNKKEMATTFIVGRIECLSSTVPGTGTDKASARPH
jgi:hypothetical protein